MKYFHNKDRVVVTDEGHPLQSKSGTVVRLLMRDHSAWVRMDEDLPDALGCSFPDPTDDRHRDILLWPDQCEKA